MIKLYLSKIVVDDILNFFYYTLPHDTGGVLWYHIGHPCVRPSVCPSVRTYARYIRRLVFVLVSGLFRHCGVKIVLQDWQIDKNGSFGVKEDQRKIKGIIS